MNILPIIILGFLATTFVSLLFVRTLLASKDRRDLSTISWQTGDVLSCVLDGMWGPFDGEHYFLAVSNNTIMHLVSPIFADKKVYFNRRGYLKENTRDSITFQTTKCRNYERNYARPVPEVVEAARRYRDKEVYVHLLYCNCEHWVNKVTKGYTGFSTTTLMWAAPWCHF